MKIFRFIKIFFISLLLILLVLSGVAWYQLEPQWEELKEKDPARFESMVKSAKGFHFKGMVGLYLEIKRMTQKEVIRIRYERWKEKRAADDEFRLAHWDNEILQREEARENKSQEHMKTRNELGGSHLKSSGPGFRKNWGKATPWHKGLILREKCLKYFLLEKRQSGKRLKGRHLSTAATLLEAPLQYGRSVPELCERLVPVSHDSEAVDEALESLRNQMNYFYFTRLLQEIGIPETEVFGFESRLNRMTKAFSGF